MIFNKNRTNTECPIMSNLHPMSLASISLVECSMLGGSNQRGQLKIATPKHSLTYSLDIRSKHNPITEDTSAG